VHMIHHTVDPWARDGNYANDPRDDGRAVYEKDVRSSVSVPRTITSEPTLPFKDDIPTLSKTIHEHSISTPSQVSTHPTSHSQNQLRPISSQSPFQKSHKMKVSTIPTSAESNYTSLMASVDEEKKEQYPTIYSGAGTSAIPTRDNSVRNANGKLFSSPLAITRFPGPESAPEECQRMEQWYVLAKRHRMKKNKHSLGAFMIKSALLQSNLCLNHSCESSAHDVHVYFALHRANIFADDKHTIPCATRAYEPTVQAIVSRSIQRHAPSGTSTEINESKWIAWIDPTYANRGGISSPESDHVLGMAECPHHIDIKFSAEKESAASGRDDSSNERGYTDSAMPDSVTIQSIAVVTDRSVLWQVKTKTLNKTFSIDHIGNAVKSVHPFRFEGELKRSIEYITMYEHSFWPSRNDRMRSMFYLVRPVQVSNQWGGLSHLTLTDPFYTSSLENAIATTVRGADSTVAFTGILPNITHVEISVPYHPFATVGPYAFLAGALLMDWCANHAISNVTWIYGPNVHSDWLKLHPWTNRACLQELCSWSIFTVLPVLNPFSKAGTRKIAKQIHMCWKVQLDSAGIIHRTLHACLQRWVNRALQTKDKYGMVDVSEHNLAQTHGEWDEILLIRLLQTVRPIAKPLFSADSFLRQWCSHRTLKRAQSTGALLKQSLLDAGRPFVKLTQTGSEWFFSSESRDRVIVDILG
jgi:hypothetical protein